MFFTILFSLFFLLLFLIFIYSCLYEHYFRVQLFGTGEVTSTSELRIRNCTGVFKLWNLESQYLTWSAQVNLGVEGNPSNSSNDNRH